MVTGKRISKKEICERIFLTRQKRRFTQAKLGMEMHCDQSKISAIENGEKKLDIEDLQALCDALDVSIQYILFGD